MNARALACVFIALFAVTGCDGKKESEFEKRYVRLQIPGFGEKDYLGLLDSKEADIRYNGAANFLDFLKPASSDPSRLDAVKAFKEKAATLFNDPSPKVRAIMAFSAKKGETAEFAKQLIKLTQDKSSEVRLESVTALGEICSGSPAAAQAILNAIKDESVLVRLQAIETSSACRLSPLRGQFVASLLLGLDQTTRSERLKRVEALGYLAQPKETEATFKALLNSNDAAAVNVSTMALAHQKSPAAVEPLRRMIEQNCGDNKALIGMLKTVGGDKSVETLIPLLDSSDKDLRKDIIQTLGDLHTDQAAAALEKKFEQEIPTIENEINSVKWTQLDAERPEFQTLFQSVVSRWPAAGEAPDESSLMRLLTGQKISEKLMALHFLEDGEPFDRTVVKTDKEKQDIFPSVGRLYEDPSLFVRLHTVRALGNLTDVRALPILQLAAQNPVYGIRYEAIEALAKYAKNTGNVAPLNQLYDVRETWVPRAFTDQDGDFLMRQLIEEKISGFENYWLTLRRRKSELVSASKPARIIAALGLASMEDAAGLPVLFEYFPSASPDEKKALLDDMKNISTVTAQMAIEIKKLQSTETNAEVKKNLDAWAKKLTVQS